MDAILMCRNGVLWWGCVRMGRFGVGLLKSAGIVAGTCVFAIGGALIGGIAGAMKGQTTETGICRGAGIGVLSGAIVALELLDSIIYGHFLSKVALFGSIVNGKAFMEWVSPAVLKAYLWQISMLEGGGNDVLDIYDCDETRGMSCDQLNRLPMILYCSQMTTSNTAASCPICLQDLVNGEKARILPQCQHFFHSSCIDQWLVRCASCPVCRQQMEPEEYNIECTAMGNVDGTERERAYDDSQLMQGEDIFVENQEVLVENQEVVKK